MERSEGRGRGRRSGRRPRDSGQPAQVRKPVFKKVEDIEPEMTGINAKLLVVSSGNRGEFIMGDDSGTVVVIVNDVGLSSKLTEGTSVIVRNGFVEMKEDSFIRLATNEWGKVQISDERWDFVVKKNNNISEIEYTVE